MNAAATKREHRKQIIAALAAQGVESCDAGRKGDGLFIRGRGFVSTVEAAKLAGLPRWEAKAREPHMVSLPWGDYATIAMINRVRA